jgi:hypothetical protein
MVRMAKKIIANVPKINVNAAMRTKYTKPADIFRINEYVGKIDLSKEYSRNILSDNFKDTKALYLINLLIIGLETYSQ